MPSPPALVSAGAPSYQVQRSCQANAPVITFTLTVRNAGAGRSTAIADPLAAQVTSDLPGWSAGAPLPAIPAGASTTVTLSLPAYANSQAMAGTHRFALTINKRPAGIVTANIPPRQCLPAVQHGVMLGRLWPPIATQPAGPGSKTLATNNGITLVQTVAITRFLAAPTGVQTTTNLGTCSSHAVSFACMLAMKSGYYLLVWDWNNASCPSGDQCLPAPQGYRVYGNGKFLAASTPDQTALAFDPAAVGTPCFTVTAYSGATESAQSSKVCVAKGNAAGVQTLTLPAVHVLSNEISQSNTKFKHDPRDNNEPGVLAVGFTYHTTKDFVNGDSSLNTATRGAVLFDVSTLAGRSVGSAVLHLHVASSIIGSDYETNSFTNCITKIGSGQSDWWDNTAWFDGDWFATHDRNGPDVAIDVTRYVQSWVAGASNYGFVFQGSEENMNAFTENSCKSTYASPTLQVNLIGS